MRTISGVHVWARVRQGYCPRMTGLLPAYDRVIARVRQYDDMHAEHNPCVRYVKRVVVVCRTVQLRHSFPHLGLLWLVSRSMATPRTWTRRRYRCCIGRTAANVGTGRSLMTCQTNSGPKFRPNRRVLTATHYKVWKLQR